MGKKESIKFHIKNKELFAQVATKIDCLRQSVTIFGWSKQTEKQLSDLTNELMWLHFNYKVVSRKKLKHQNYHRGLLSD